MKIFKSKNTEASVIFEIAITLVISLVFFLSPLFFSGQTLQGADYEKMMVFYFLALSGSIIWVGKGVVSGKLSLKRTPLDIPFLILFLLLSVSTVFSVSVKDSLMGAFGSPAKGFIAFVVFALFYYLVVNNSDNKKIKIYFWSFLSSAALVSVYSLFQLSGVYILPFKFTEYVNFNPIGSLSSLSIFLAVVLPLLAVTYSQLENLHPEMKKVVRIILKSLLFLAIIVDLAVMVILNGYTFWFAALAGVVIVLMFLLSKILKASGASLMLIILIFIVLIFQVALGKINFFDLKSSPEVSLSLKSSMDIALKSIAKDPFFGSGPATFYYDFSRYKTPDFNNMDLWNTRFNSAAGIFELASTTGVLGALAGVAIILIILTLGFLDLIRGKNELKSLSLGFFASFSVITIFSLFFSLSSALILIFALLGTLGASIFFQSDGKTKVLELSFWSAPQYALALAALFLTISAGVAVLFTLGFKVYLADVYAQKALASGNIEDQANKMIKAIELSKYQENYYFYLSNAYLVMANQATSNNKNSIVQYLNNAISLGNQAMGISPKNVVNIETLAGIYENASYFDASALNNSEELLKQALLLDPNNPNLDFRLGLINSAKADYAKENKDKEPFINEALKKFDQAIGKKVDFAAAYYSKATIYEKISKSNESIEQLKQAVKYSNDVNYNFELGRLYFNRGAKQSNIASSSPYDGNNLQLSSQNSDKLIEKNEDLAIAEKIFLDIIAVDPKNANSLYSLAMLYKKTGDSENTKKMVTDLLRILPEDQTKESVKKQFEGLY